MMQPYVDDTSTFEYVQPAPLNRKLLLLTKDNVLVIGAWKGEPMPHNKTYKAWHGLPGRDKDIESKLGYR